MNWDAWMEKVREYDERTFADYIDKESEEESEEEDLYDE